VAQLSVASQPAARRDEALALYRALPNPGPPPGRYWKIDLDKLDLDRLAVGSAEPEFALSAEAQRAGVVASDVRAAEQHHPVVLASAQGSAVDWRGGKFTALNAAYREGGAFIFLPKGVALEDPIVVRQRLHGPAAFPYTLVVASEGAKATVIVRYESEGVSLVSEIVEVVVHERAEVAYAAIQNLPDDARIFSSRRGTVRKDAQLAWAIAELGASLSIGDVRAAAIEAGARATIAGLFFPARGQHVDVQSEADHPAGATQSETLFKSAATGGGQARFIGNIRIHPAAHGVDATLRDDALLLSEDAHIDSIPALEIGANDVRAYHGATIGAIDQEELFYAMSRGLDRSVAERMIALGFFEPAVARFPTESLREELRAALAQKVG
jgi:Fe-S cluster assembly protein SufD